MASFLKKTMLYLGLGPDDEYDLYDDAPDPVHDGRDSVHDGRDHADRRDQVATVTRVAPRAQPSSTDSLGAVRPIRVGAGGSSSTMGAAAMGLADSVGARPMPRAGSSVVRPIPREAHVKPHSITPISFNDAQQIADWFKYPQPVIINLEAADRDLRRRLIDFCSGLCYGLGGQMERVADHVYLLTPTNVVVSAEDRHGLEHGAG